MGSNLEKLLTKNRSKARKGRKLFCTSVTPEVRVAFGRACKAGGTTLSDCIEAMMLDFIAQRAFAPERLHELKFVGTADQYERTEEERQKYQAQSSVS